MWRSLGRLDPQISSARTPIRALLWVSRSRERYSSRHVHSSIRCVSLWTLWWRPKLWGIHDLHIMDNVNSGNKQTLTAYFLNNFLESLLYSNARLSTGLHEMGVHLRSVFPAFFLRYLSAEFLLFISVPLQ